MTKVVAYVFDEFEQAEVGRDVYGAIVHYLSVPREHNLEKLTQVVAGLLTVMINDGAISLGDAEQLLEGITLREIQT